LRPKSKQSSCEERSPSPPCAFSAMVGTARCAVPDRVVAVGTNVRATPAFEEVAPLHAARTSQRDDICLAPKERQWERGVYAASTHDCQQATDCSNALLLATLKRRERRAPLNAYRRCPYHAKHRLSKEREQLSCGCAALKRGRAHTTPETRDPRLATANHDDKP